MMSVACNNVMIILLFLSEYFHLILFDKKNSCIFFAHSDFLIRFVVLIGLYSTSLLTLIVVLWQSSYDYSVLSFWRILQFYFKNFRNSLDLIVRFIKTIFIIQICETTNRFKVSLILRSIWCDLIKISRFQCCVRYYYIV